MKGIYLAQDRPECEVLVNTPSGSIKDGEYLDYLSDCYTLMNDFVDKIAS
jgi:hypothetical protein